MLNQNKRIQELQLKYRGMTYARLLSDTVHYELCKCSLHIIQS